MHISRRSVAVPTVIVSVLILLSGAIYLAKKSVPRMSDAEDLRLFMKVVIIVKNNYVEEVDGKKLMQGAITGMLASLDPHSDYLPAKDYTEMKVHMAGAFGGIGIALGMAEGRLLVENPIEDTPAFRAGIKGGDHIWKIDGAATRGMNITKAVSLMRGTPGTRVTLTILRNGSPQPLTFPLVRAIIKTKSLKVKTLEPGYGYIGIAEFQGRTGEDFTRALATLHRDNKTPLKGLILDLRFNPGGLLDQAGLVVDRFIGEKLDNGLIVTTKGRDPSSRSEISAFIGGKEPPYPMVVLINGSSASASEIVAGALQDHKRAVIMGTQSFGKGSVQSVITLRNGDGLKLTTAKYYTPNGRSIQARGITPDIIVTPVKLSTSKIAKDKPFREKDLENHFETSDSIPAAEKSRTTPPADQPRLLLEDYQLSRALELLRGINIMTQQGVIK